MHRLKISIGLRLYIIIGLTFCGLAGLGLMQWNTLGESLKQQRQSELTHLTQLALGIAHEEYASVQRGTADDVARKNAAARISKLRYGNDDYFWINDLRPRDGDASVKPELNGSDLSGNKDPNGKRLFVEFVDVVKKQKAGFVDYLWPKPGKDAPQPKLSYVIGFEPWGWVIGTGRLYRRPAGPALGECAHGDDRGVRRHRCSRCAGLDDRAQHHPSSRSPRRANAVAGRWGAGCSDSGG